MHLFTVLLITEQNIKHTVNEDEDVARETIQLYLKSVFRWHNKIDVDSSH